MTRRYWVSWWSGNYADEGCTLPPFSPFVTGARYRNGDMDERDEESFCAVMEATSEEAIWALVRRHYPDAEERFIETVAADWMPNDRFPGAGVYRLAGQGEEGGDAD